MITALDDPRLELARKTVGAIRIVPDPTLPPRLLRLVDTRGQAYLAKQHTRHDRYAQEAQAYLMWQQLLRGYTAQLIGRQDSTYTLLFTALPGDCAAAVEHDTAEEEREHHAAGLVLGTLHRATSMGTSNAIGSELAQRLRSWTAKADQADLISTSERRWLLHSATRLADSSMDSSICHLDYQPRNWLVAAGRFWICDFEHTRRDARVRDFARLEYRRWQAMPHLREAFSDGYGAQLTRTEQQLLELFGAIEAATALVRGHEQDDIALRAHGGSVLSRLK
ncbi:phosphotransferase [Streptomyces phaeochromogenes]|uniref:Phosphotransferase n=1 Tax=Streptomyces phaeochromogenes TaxID=1923 RepID=A0ABZ1H9P1_STRPH|nr:phosphotransferase [Streptomyces phaeochromogenes]WSD14298.1 phosphotransferase [Streptomyces phaeochromogenes]